MAKRHTGPRLPIDENRKQVFLQELSRTGSVTAAARAASPHAIGHDGGLAGFMGLALRDPEFASAIESAKEAALGEVEKEIHRRAMNPPTRPVWHRGEVVGEYEDRTSSDKLLLRLAERLSPEGWAPQSRVKTEVNVQGVMLAIRPEDVLLLDPAEQSIFVKLLGQITDLRGEEESVPELLSDLEVLNGS
jgi:hypothetical protein